MLIDVLLVGTGAVLACAYGVRLSRRARIQRLDAAATAPVTVDGRETSLHVALWAMVAHGGADEVARVLLTTRATTADAVWREALRAAQDRDPGALQASARHASLERQVAVERAVWRAHTRLVRSATSAGVVERTVVALDSDPEWVQGVAADLGPAVPLGDARSVLALVDQLVVARISTDPVLEADPGADLSELSEVPAARSLVVTSEHASDAAARLADSVPDEDWAGVTYPMRDVIAGVRAERSRLLGPLREIALPRFRRSLGQTALFLLAGVADADLSRRTLELEVWDAEVEELRRTATPAERGVVLASRADLCRRLVVDHDLLDEVLDACTSVVELQRAGVRPAA